MVLRSTQLNFGARWELSMSRFGHYIREPSSSVSIVSGLGLDYRAIEVRSPADISSSLSLLPNGYRGSFPRAKARPGRDADHLPPSSAEVESE
jgi:hypothetical protein